MRIASLLPSATEIVYALGLGDELVGRTHECDYPPEAVGVRVLTSDVGGRPDEPGDEIHARVRGALHDGGAIYRLDLEALEEAAPDLILTQQLCDVCAVSYRDVSAAARALPGSPTVVSLEPTSLEGVLNTIITVGAMAEAEDEAVGLIELLRERLRRLEGRVLERRLVGAATPRVVLLEWVDPPFAAGHWVPDQVRLAGGWELLGQAGERSVETTWQTVADVDPDVVVVAACGFDAARGAEEWRRAVAAGRVPALRAADEGRVVALDGSAYFSRPGPRLVDGVALLAEVFDPGRFEDEAPAGGTVPLA